MKLTESRERIVNHGAGKGDKSRVTDEAAFQRNIAAVHFPGVQGFRRVGKRLVKVYDSTRG